jgi:hypothetical protein
MGLFKKCEDPLIVEVRKTYNANPIRMPRADIAPLCVIASKRQRADFLGRMQPLLVGSDVLDVTPRRAAVSSSLLEKSRSVNLDVGLNLLGGFLAAWGVPSAEIGLQFKGATKVSFRFSSVARWFVDATDLSAAVQNRRIKLSNPLVSNFLGDDPLGFYVIDATITSRDFAMRVEKTQTDAFNLAIPAIQEIVGKANAGIQVESRDALEIAFKGSLDMPFAFSCLEFVLGDQGKIGSIKLHENLPSFGFEGKPSGSKQVLLTEEPGLLTFDSAVAI